MIIPKDNSQLLNIDQFYLKETTPFMINIKLLSNKYFGPLKLQV